MSSRFPSLTCTARVGCLALVALVVATPLRAQETDSIPSRAWISASRESPPPTLPSTDVIVRDRPGRQFGLKADRSEERAIRMTLDWPSDKRRSRQFIIGGTVIGAVAGLVAFAKTEGTGCMDDPDPVTGGQVESRRGMSCIIQTSLPIYVGGGALGGGIVGWLVDRLAR